MARQFALDLTVIRPVWIYGPRELHAGPYEYCQTILSGTPWMPGSRSNRFHSVYVGDVARAVVAVIQSRPQGLKIYHVGPLEAQLQHDYFGTFARYLGVRQPRFLPRWLLLPLVIVLELFYLLFRFKNPPLLTRARLEMFYANNVYDTQAIMRDLAFVADTPLDRGVRLTVRWWRMYGYLPRPARRAEPLQKHINHQQPTRLAP